MYPSVVGGGGKRNITDGKPSKLTGGTPPQMDLVGAGITILWVQCILGSEFVWTVHNLFYYLLKSSCWWFPSWPEMGFPQIRVPQNGWFIEGILLKKDYLGVPPFQENPKWGIQSCLLDAKTPSYDLEADVGLVNIARDSWVGSGPNATPWKSLRCSNNCAMDRPIWT